MYLQNSVTMVTLIAHYALLKDFCLFSTCTTPSFMTILSRFCKNNSYFWKFKSSMILYWYCVTCQCINTCSLFVAFVVSVCPGFETFMPSPKFVSQIVRTNPGVTWSPSPMPSFVAVRVGPLERQSEIQTKERRKVVEEIWCNFFPKTDGWLDSKRKRKQKSLSSIDFMK